MSPVGGQAPRGVRRRHPQVPRRQALPVGAASRSRIAKTEPGDENNQDISSLVGKVDIRKLETYAQDDPGRLQLLRRPVPGQPGPARIRRDVQGADQGAAPAADGHAGRQLQGHRRLRRDPVRRHRPRALATSREWKTFRNNKNNEAFLDRIYIVKVPYCLRVSEEVKIYEKLLRNSSLAEAPCAPGTLKMMAQFADADAPEGAGELAALLEDAGLRRREPEGHRPARPRATRSTATTPASTRA